MILLNNKINSFKSFWRIPECKLMGKPMSKQVKVIILSLLGVVSACTAIVIIFTQNENLELNKSLPELGTAVASQDTKSFPVPDNITSNLKYNSWYVIKLGNIPIGIASVGVENQTSGYPSNYTIQFVSRIGASPLLSILKGDLNFEDSKIYKLQQSIMSQTENGSFKELQNVWRQDAKDNALNLIKDSGASLLGIIPATITKGKVKLPLDDGTALFYYASKEKNTANSKVFVPFLGQFFSQQDIDAKYDEDGFLNSAILPLEGGAELAFSRVTKSKYNDYTKNVADTLIDFGWFSSFNSLKNEFEIIKKSLSNCSERTSVLKNKMLHFLPQSSYLSYRRIVNMSHFCLNLNREITQKENETNLVKLNIIANSIKNLLKENSQELPYFLAYSPDTSLFYNDTISYLWPRITSLITQTALNELENNFDLDKNRKSLVGIQLNIANLQPRAVVRAQIKLIDASLNFKVETAKIANMSGTSLTEIPASFNSQFSVIYLNGQSFAKKMDINIDSICKLNSGKVGIDLGDAPQFAINAETVRGVWDVQTRVEVARQFAIKSTISKSCNEVYFRVPLSIEKAVNKEIEQFKKETLGSENELLLSNNVQKKLWILPGKYRLTVTSLVTGAVISAQEFSVASGYNTNVTAKIN